MQIATIMALTYDCNMRVYYFLILTFWCGTFFVSPAKADIINEIFRIECIPELNVLTISDFRTNGNLPSQLLDKNSNILAQKYGIYPYAGNIIEFEKNYTAQYPKIFESVSSSVKTRNRL